MRKIIPFLLVFFIAIMVIFLLQYCKKSDGDSGNNNNNNNTPCTPKPTTPGIYTNAPVKVGDTLKLRAFNVDAAATNIHWTGPNAYVADGQVVQILHASTLMIGTYSVTQTVNGCTSDAGTAYIDVKTLKTYTFNLHTYAVYPSDYKDRFSWNNGKNWLTNAASDVDGATNQAVIIYIQGQDEMYAALVCKNIKDYGYSDWYLPAKDELSRVYYYKDVFGGFTNEPYWSSSEVDLGTAIAVDFTDGTIVPTDKYTACLIRCVKRIN